MRCRRCGGQAQVELHSHHTAFCGECFLEYFRRQVRRAISSQRMFGRGDRVLVAVSGGKDSLALWDVLLELGYQVEGLHIDLGIGGYSEASRQRVEAFSQRRGAALRVVELAREGFTVPELARRSSREVCSVCGSVKRYLMNRMAHEGGFTVLATGHNLDDEASRLLANLLRWQLWYLRTQGPVLPAEGKLVKRVRPLFRLTEYETAAYAFLRGIDYVVQECPYSRGATFLRYKQLLRRLEHDVPGTLLNFYQGFLKEGKACFGQDQRSYMECERCGYPTTVPVCGFCRLKEAMQCGSG